MPSPNVLARIAGFLYLLMAVCSGFALGYVPSRVVESGDAAATADSIRASASLFRVAFVINLVQAACFLLTAMALYLLLKHVNQLVAAAMVTFVAVDVAIQSLNLLNQYTALTIATSAGYTHAFGKVGSDALTMLFADMQRNGFTIAEMFFGLWLLPLGYLVIKSGYLPKVLGVLLMVGCFAYLADLFSRFLAPDFATTIAPLVAVAGAAAESSFAAWLLAKGVRAPEPDARVPAMAESSGSA